METSEAWSKNPAGEDVDHPDGVESPLALYVQARSSSKPPFARRFVKFPSRPTVPPATVTFVVDAAKCAKSLAESRPKVAFVVRRPAPDPLNTTSSEVPSDPSANSHVAVFVPSRVVTRDGDEDADCGIRKNVCEVRMTVAPPAQATKSTIELLSVPMTSANP